jgi:hypothetical protein
MDANIVDRDTPENLSDYLNLLPGYDCSWNQDVLLDISREVWDADAYYWIGVPFPTGPDIFFNQPGSAYINQTFAGDLQIPPFSLLTSITAYSRGNPDQTNAPFKLRVYDKGGKVDMIHKQFSLVDNVGSRQEVAGINPPGPDQPFGPYLLTSPKFIMPPGILHVEITDLSGIVNVMIQVFFALAVPINAQSTGNKLIDEG